MTENTEAELAQAFLDGLNEYPYHLAATLRRMRNATVMPIGVSQDDLHDVIDAGYLTYIVGRFAPGIYIITDAGHEFLREH